MLSCQSTYCLNCNSKHEYKLITVRKDMEVRGTRFSYTETQAICKCCGTEVYIAEVMDGNVTASQEAYRKAAKLITVEEIKMIMDKYSIGAGPLAQVLGFGEVTINRYLNGQLPSKSHSDLLLEVLASYKKFREHFERNGHLLSTVASKKCHEKMEEFDKIYSKNKIDCVTRYILSKAGEITPLALQKLLYYVQSFFVALYQIEIFPEPCQAWVHGPVYPDVYYKYNKFGYNPIEQLPMEDDDFDKMFTNTEIALLDAIIASFGCYSGEVLRNMTHNECPWLAARGNLHPGDRSSNELSKTVIKEYFESVVKQYNIVNPCDIKNYSTAMMKKLY